MRFRGDINGLRAIAVVAVVLFHFGVAGAEGGFVGVDVFFVISGFLMTAIIFGRLENDNFSLVEFYKDRAKRIVPALAFLCLVLLVAGWALLLPGAYVELSENTLGSLGFVSNMLYWKDAGYFEPVSHDNWLLHTWSLSIEWQFYLAYPLIILLLRQVLSVRGTGWVLAVMALGSLALSVYASSRWPTSAFFLLPTRMWELLAGGLVFLFPLAAGKHASRALELGGVALIVLAVVTLSEESIWPGWLALIPVVGTMMVIYSARHESILTGNRASQFLGRISYSVYLWHWPIAVWIYYFGLEREPGWVIAGLVASTLCGWASYRYIERLGQSPSQRSVPRRTVRPLLRVGGSVLAIGAVATLTMAAEGYPDRISAEFREATADLVLPKRANGWCFYDVETNERNEVGEAAFECSLGEPEGKIDALLFGDSFAGHYGPFWDVLGKERGIAINSVASNWCYPSVTDDFTGYRSGPGFEQCLLNRRYLQEHVADFDLVIYAGQWGAIHTKQQMTGVFKAIELAAQRAELVVLMAAPTNYDVSVKNMYERSLMFDRQFDITRFEKERDGPVRVANEQLRRVAQRYPNVLFISRDAMFHVEGVPSDVTADNVPFGLDQSGHISVYGSRMAAEAFRQTRLYQDFIERTEHPALLARRRSG